MSWSTIRQVCIFFFIFMENLLKRGRYTRYRQDSFCQRVK